MYHCDNNFVSIWHNVQQPLLENSKKKASIICGVLMLHAGSTKESSQDILNNVHLFHCLLK